MSSRRLRANSGAVAAIGLQGRFSPVIRRLHDLVEDGYVGRVVDTSLVSSCWVYGATTPEVLAFMVDPTHGATLLTVQMGNVIDAVAYCVGELTEVTRSIATVRPEVEVEETGEILHRTAPDQIAVTGVLEGGGVPSVHLRGGTTRATNFYWEINGTEGDLLVTGPTCHFNNDDLGQLALAGARDEETSVQPLEIPDDYRWAPADTPLGPAYNVAQLYAHLASDIRKGASHCPTFAHAAARHELLGAIERAANTGGRQATSLDASAVARASL